MLVNFWTVKNGMLGPVCRTEEVSKRNAIHQLHLIEQFCSGYLLYGEPGTGKSKGGRPSLLSLVVDYPILGSTIHALASELGLEIYYVQLASQG